MRDEARPMFESMLAQIDVPATVRSRARAHLDQALEREEQKVLGDSDRFGGRDVSRKLLRTVVLAALVLSMAGLGTAIALSSRTERPSGGSPRPSTPGEPPTCSRDHIVVTTGSYAVAMNSYEQLLTLRNTGSAVCSLPGWPKVTGAEIHHRSVVAVDAYLTELRPSASSGVTLEPSQVATFAIYGQSFNAVQNKSCPQARALAVQWGGSGVKDVRLSLPACTYGRTLAITVTPLVAGRRSLGYFSRYSQVRTARNGGDVISYPDLGISYVLSRASTEGAPPDARSKAAVESSFAHQPVPQAVLGSRLATRPRTIQLAEVTDTSPQPGTGVTAGKPYLAWVIAYSGVPAVSYGPTSGHSSERQTFLGIMAVYTGRWTEFLSG